MGPGPSLLVPEERSTGTSRARQWQRPLEGTKRRFSTVLLLLRVAPTRRASGSPGEGYPGAMLPQGVAGR